MTTSEMRAAEVEGVSDLLRESYAVLAEREGLTAEQLRYLATERGSVECVRRESTSQRYLVARDGDRLAGMVAVSGDTIIKLYVSPSRLGEGIGRSLYEAAESVIRNAGHDRVALGAFPSAVPFYRRMGLRVIGRRRATGPLRDLTVALMEKRLRPEANGGSV
jgi:GNAT superfamily N-acetyltransferase